jgi:hypothetical protein
VPGRCAYDTLEAEIEIMIRKNLLGAALLTLLTLACGGGDGPSDEPTTLTPLTVDTARVGEIVILQVKGGAAIDAAVITGSIGGLPVQLARVADSALVFLLPDLPPGEYVVQVVLGGETVEMPVTVQAPREIGDPLAVIDSFFDAVLAGYPVETPSWIDSAGWAARRNSIDSLVTSGKAQAAALSTAERLTVARIITAGSLTAPAPSAVAALAATGCDDATNEVVWAALDMASWTAITASTAALGTVTAGASAVVAVGAAVKLHDRWGNFWSKWDTRAEQCEAQIDVEADNWLGFAPRPMVSASASARAGEIRYYQGRPIAYRPHGSFRPLDRTDIKGDPQLTREVELVEQIQNGWGKIAPAITNVVGAAPPSLADVEPSAAEDRPIGPDSVTITNIRPASVGLTITRDSVSIRLTSTTNPTVEVPFTFDIVSVNDPDVKVSKSGVLRPYMTMTITGSPTTVTGERQLLPGGGGMLVCDPTLTAKVRGGELAEVRVTAWELADTSEVDTLDTPLEISEGDYPVPTYFDWPAARNEDGSLTWRPFAATQYIQWYDRQREITTTTSFTFNCQ